MIEIKATTENHATEVDVKVDADLIEYGAEVLAIIESLMGALKRDDARLHTAVLMAMNDNPRILFGEEVSVESEPDMGATLARLMSKSIIKKGVN